MATHILGLGNALLDILITLPDDDALVRFGLPKGSMNHVPRSLADEVMAYCHSFPKTIVSGGSAANAIHGLASLGNATAFAGKIGYDSFGIQFRTDMEKAGIRPLFVYSGTETGTAVALLTPDRERTFAVFLGAALDLGPGDLTDGLFEGSDLLHIEGYLVQNHALIAKAVTMAKTWGMLVSLDLSSYNVVQANLGFLGEILTSYVDIVFANEDEAQAFTGLPPEQAAGRLASLCDIAVVKTGAGGSLVQSGSVLHRIGITTTEVTDTTGAGDLYAAGFLHGFIHQQPLDHCGRIGALLAGKVIGRLGARIPHEQWPDIIREIRQITG